MGFMKKQSAGFYFTVLSAVLAVVGVVFYLVNCKTAYFANFGVNAVVVACAVIAVVVQAVLVGASQAMGGKKALDVLFLAAAVLLAVAFVTFVGARVASIATIMTFENNASTMADLSSALVGLVCMALAMVASIAASFCRIVKE